MRIFKENTVGLIIDVQERLFPVMYEKERFLSNSLILIAGLQQLGVPLLLTQQYTKGLGETIPKIKSSLATFDHIEKRAFSCCGEPSVMQKLSALRANNVIIFGIESHVCVLQTAIDLKENGFNPIVVMDCVTSRQPESIEWAKERFRYENIMMTSLESLLFELTQTSEAAAFKAISKLLK